MQEEETIEARQKFLRKQIIEGGFQPEPFMIYMGSIKNQGEEINIEKWTIEQLRKVVKDYKACLNEQVKWEKEKMSKFRQSKQMMTSRIMQSIEKKEKVYYGRAQLWDYEIHTEQECKKIQKFFVFQKDPEIDYKSWDIKKRGGFLFGLGATNELQITFITNFTNQNVTRRSQDLDWLRQTLIHNYPGSFIPPLQPIRHIQPEDKTGIMRRVKQMVLFLNSLTHFDYLIQNRYFHHFITDSDKDFKNFKSQANVVKLTADIGSIQNLEGKFKVQISQRMNNFVNDSSQYAHQANEIYDNIENNFRKVMGDMETFTKHTHYIANDYGKMHDKYTKMVDKCKLKDDQMVNVMIYLNNLFTTLGNVMKKNMLLLKELSQDFLKFTHGQWSEFLIHEKKYQHQLGNYLNLKETLQKKKEKSLNDSSKWELSEKQQFRMSRVDIGKIPKEEAFEIMFPRENQAEEEMRIWQAYVNNMYERSFKILLKEQEKMYIKNYGSYCKKIEKVNEEQSHIFQKFREIFLNEKEKK